MHVHTKTLAAGAAASALLMLAGCADTPTSPPAGDGRTGVPSHVHAVVDAPDTDQLLLGTHEGIYEVTDTGEWGGRVSTDSFDAMGLTATSQTLIASGHPGPGSPAEWGAPNLGVMRSTDAGVSWESVVFGGEKDFHALAAGADDTVYAIATDVSDVIRSDDAGLTWEPTGADLVAASLAVDGRGRVIAATEEGVQISTDGGASFAAWPEAPLLYTLGAAADRTQVVGVGTDGQIWVTGAGAASWEPAGRVDGRVQAVGMDAAGRIVIVDETSGITILPG